MYVSLVVLWHVGVFLSVCSYLVAYILLSRRDEKRFIFLREPDLRTDSFVSTFARQLFVLTLCTYVQVLIYDTQDTRDIIFHGRFS